MSHGTNQGKKKKSEEHNENHWEQIWIRNKSEQKQI